MVHKMGKWDTDILNNILDSVDRRIDIDDKATLKAELKDEYVRLRGEGWSPEGILDRFSSQTADTRWIYWLKSTPKGMIA